MLAMILWVGCVSSLVSGSHSFPWLPRFAYMLCSEGIANPSEAQCMFLFCVTSPSLSHSDLLLSSGENLDIVSMLTWEPPAKLVVLLLEAGLPGC
jgi:hypothetical protein